MPIDLSKIAQEVQLCLHNNILPYWLRLRDPVYGGYYGQVRGDETIVTTADRSAVLYARLLWTFSACGLLDEAQELKAYILSHFIDPIYGGTYWAIDYQGAPIDTKKQFYAQAFMMYGFAEHALVTQDASSLDCAVNIYHLLEQHARDRVNGGYLEAATRDWQSLQDNRLSPKDENSPKSQNTNLHILEAYTLLYQIYPNEELKMALQDLIHTFTNCILQPSGHLGLFFDSAWHVSNSRYSYGHDIEASWLLDEAAQVVQVDVSDAVKRLSDWQFPIDKAPQMDWWESAEAMVGYHNRYLHFRDESALNQVREVWTFIQQHLLDYQHGEWYWSAMHDVHQDKAGFWKCPYHNARMCLKLSKTINRK